MRKVFPILFLLFHLQSFSQSSQSFDLSNEDRFLDSRRMLTNDSNYSSIIGLHDKNYEFHFHPLYEFTYGYDNVKNSFQRYAIGAQMLLSSNKLQLGLSYMYTSGEYMNYRTELINGSGVVPGIGNKNGSNIIKSQYWDAFLEYKPNDIFRFELGYGRKFIGSGHRSLLLSDQSSPYPYLMLQTSFWKLKYTNLFSLQQNTFAVVGDRDLYQQKFSASHYLELTIGKKLHVGLFETVIWQSDEGSYIRGFDPNYLNPVIFYRPVEFSIGSSDNVIIGANMTYDITEDYSFYTQALLDEFLLSEMRADFRQFLDPDEDIKSGWWGNKYGLQFGVRSTQFFGREGLFMRLEYNLVRPYTYAHSSPTQAYTHNSSPLGHPLGANFEEAIAQLSYSWDKYKISAQFNQSRQGISPAGTNFGENPEISNTTREKEYENTIGQGIPTFRRYVETYVSRRLRLLWGSEVSLGYVWRQVDQEDWVDVNTMIFFSIKTNILRQGFDF